MIEVTAADVTQFAPEFSDLPSSQIDLIIEYARNWVCEDKWGSKSKLGIVLMSAHLLKEAGFGPGDSSSASGPVTSERVGDLQRSYGQVSLQNSSVGDQLLATTKYGRLFLTLRRTLVITPMVT